MQKKILAIGALVGLGVFGRVLPHVPNATPTTAIALTARRTLGAGWSLAIVLGTMLLSDLIIGFYDWRVMVSVYLSFALIVLLGARAKGIGRTALALIAANVLFFLVTNGASWLISDWYPKTLEGLLYCYTLGLPFARSMLLGDLFYVSVLLGAQAWGGTIVRYAAAKYRALTGSPAKTAFTE